MILYIKEELFELVVLFLYKDLIDFIIIYI